MRAEVDMREALRALDACQVKPSPEFLEDGTWQRTPRSAHEDASAYAQSWPRPPVPLSKEAQEARRPRPPGELVEADMARVGRDHE